MPNEKQERLRKARALVQKKYKGFRIVDVDPEYETDAIPRSDAVSDAADEVLQGLRRPRAAAADAPEMEGADAPSEPPANDDIVVVIEPEGVDARRQGPGKRVVLIDPNADDDEEEFGVQG